MREVTGQPRTNSSGLARDFRLLEILASDRSTRQGGYGVTELAKLTGRSKTVVSRALATLAEAGLVMRDPASQKYRVGPRIFALAAKSAEARLVQCSKPVLRSLVAATRETAHLCVLTHGNVLTLASELSPHELRSAGWEGVMTAAWRSSSGWVLLSDWDDASLEQWYAEHGRDETVIDGDMFGREPSPFLLRDAELSAPGRVHNFDTLTAEIARIRADGYSILDEDLESGVVGISAPVVDHTGRVVAALNVSGPKKRLGDKIDPLSTIVRQAARTLSRALGS